MTSKLSECQKAVLAYINERGDASPGQGGVPALPGQDRERWPVRLATLHRLQDLGLITVEIVSWQEGGWNSPVYHAALGRRLPPTTTEDN